MAKKPTPSASPPESELTDAVDRLADSVSVLIDMVTELRSDIAWIINNRAEFRCERPPELLMCSECETTTDSLTRAADAGWAEIQKNDEAVGAYWGLCPKCIDEFCAVKPGPVLPTGPIEGEDAEDAPDEDPAEPEHPKDTLF